MFAVFVCFHVLLGAFPANEDIQRHSVRTSKIIKDFVALSLTSHHSETTTNDAEYMESKYEGQDFEEHNDSFTVVEQTSTPLHANKDVARQEALKRQEKNVIEHLSGGENMKTEPNGQPGVPGYMLLLFEALQELDKYQPSHQYGTETKVPTVEGHPGDFSQYRSLSLIYSRLFDFLWCKHTEYQAHVKNIRMPVSCHLFVFH